MSIKSKRNQEGYFQVDHRDSPGDPLVPKGTMLETATIRCEHCHAIVLLNPLRTRPRGYCAKCDGYYCDNPACNPNIGECKNLNALFDKIQEEAFINLNVKEI